MTEQELLKKLDELEKEVGKKFLFAYVSKGEFYAEGSTEWVFAFIDIYTTEGVKGNRRGEESDAFAAKLFDLSLSSTIVKAEPDGTKGKYGGVLKIQVEDCGGEPSNITADVIEKLLSMVDSTYARQDIVNANVEHGGDIQI